jgi:hypothetical protein
MKVKILIIIIIQKSSIIILNSQSPTQRMLFFISLILYYDFEAPNKQTLSNRFDRFVQKDDLTKLKQFDNQLINHVLTKLKPFIYFSLSNYQVMYVLCGAEPGF